MMTPLTFFNRRWWWTTLLVIAGTLVCARLGIWQLDRLEQRRAFNTHYLDMVAMAPLTLTGDQPGLTDQEYRRVTVTGQYDFENQVALRNQYHGDQYGYQLLTPLKLADGTAVIIERGWIPAEGNAAPEGWRQYDQPGSVTINGILRLGQTKPDVGGIPDAELAPGQTRLDFWNIVNLERIALQTPHKILPVFIQPNPTPAPSQPPYPYQPEVEISEGSHMGYALQWFTFATILFVGYPFFVRKQEQKTAITPSDSQVS